MKRHGLAVCSIALVLKQQGDLTGAFEWLEQARAIHECAHGPRHPDVANNLYGLACVQCLIGRLPEALALMEQAAAAGLSVFRQKQHVRNNPDLDAIRDDDRFKALFA